MKLKRGDEVVYFDLARTHTAKVMLLLPFGHAILRNDEGKLGIGRLNCFERGGD
jgi:hypothetical protein